MLQVPRIDRKTVRTCSLRNLFHPLLRKMELRTVLALLRATARSSPMRCPTSAHVAC